MGYETESIYKSLRGTLDELGYHQALSFDSLYLVKALVADLIKTTQSLKHYKDLSQKTLETCSELEVGIHPYKEDNARLLQECNQLNKKLIIQKDKHEDTQKDLKAKLRRCELDKNEVELRNGELSARLCDVEKDCLKKNERILELQNVILKRHPHRNSTTKPKCGKGDSAFSFESKLKASASVDSRAKLLKEEDSKSKQLRSEVTELTKKLDERGFVIESLQAKINSRDAEIHRLSRLLENGRPLNAVIQEHGIATPSHIQMFCTCKKDCKFAGLEHANLKLEKKLKECLRRQHDAMLHALRLSEKNKVLESRLNSKENKKESEKNHKDMLELQERITSLTKLIEDLKKENRTSQSTARTARSKTTALTSKEEKEHSELREKVEDYKIMEKDLMKEMDRLERENLLQKSYIADLESKLLACMSSKEELERASKLQSMRSETNDDAKKTETRAAQVSSTSCHTNHSVEPDKINKVREQSQSEYLTRETINQHAKELNYIKHPQSMDTKRLNNYVPSHFNAALRSEKNYGQLKGSSSSCEALNGGWNHASITKQVLMGQSDVSLKDCLRRCKGQRNLYQKSLFESNPFKDCEKCENALSQVQHRLSLVNSFHTEQKIKVDHMRELFDKTMSMYDLLRRSNKQVQTVATSTGCKISPESKNYSIQVKTKNQSPMELKKNTNDSKHILENESGKLTRPFQFERKENRTLNKPKTNIKEKCVGKFNTRKINSSESSKNGNGKQISSSKITEKSDVKILQDESDAEKDINKKVNEIEETLSYTSDIEKVSRNIDAIIKRTLPEDDIWAANTRNFYDNIVPVNAKSTSTVMVLYELKNDHYHKVFK